MTELTQAQREAIAPQEVAETAQEVAQPDERAAWDGDSEESRAAFREHDAQAPMYGRTAWQIWRDACAWQARAAPQATPKCATCNDHGMIGGPSYLEPDEGGVPCPDCAASPQAAALTDEQIESKAHRMAYRYRHGPDSIEFIFNKVTLLDFARALLAQGGNQ